MLPILQLGPLAIPVPAISMLIGLWIGMSIAERRAKRTGIRSEDLVNLLLASLLSGLAAARLGYFVRHPTAFSHNYLDILSRNPSLLDPFVGIFAAGLIALIYSQRKKMPLLQTLDALTPFLAVLSISISLTNLFSGNAYGVPTDLPWGIDLLGAKRHPNQIYELSAGIFILFIILYWKRIDQPGGLFLYFLALSAGGRIIFEAFRAESATTLFGIRTVQAGAWVVLAAAIFLSIRTRGESLKPNDKIGVDDE